MADSLEKNNEFDRRLSPSGDLGEVSVDFEVEIQGENGNEAHKETDGNSINVEGSVSGNWAGHSTKNVGKPVEKLEPGTNQPVKAGRCKQNQNRALGLLAAKLFDDKVPLRKKAGVK